jgi:four helix bundle protein
MVTTAVRSFRELVVWQKAIDLAEIIYSVSRPWPREEIYGLTSQIRRAAVSVPSNIAEGQGRVTWGEFVHQLGIAYGSLLEVETQMILAQRLGYACPGEANRVFVATAEIGRLLNGLLQALKADH